MQNEVNSMDKNNMQMVEAAEKKLRWYTMEASDEEFDEEEVDFLVDIIKRYSPQAHVEQPDMEEGQERFRAYCNLFAEDAACRNGVKISGGTENGAETELNKNLCGKIRSHRKGLTITVVAASVVLLIICGSSIGAANAGEDGGFFHWLTKDGEGTLTVTAPGDGELVAEKKTEEVYYKREEVPGEYAEYVIAPEEMDSLQGYEFDRVVVWELDTVKRIGETLISPRDRSEIVIGAYVYENKIAISSEKFDDYELLYTNESGNSQQDVFIKRNGNTEEYFICFYIDNIKYFVEGEVEVDFLETLSKEYMNWICNNATKK